MNLSNDVVDFPIFRIMCGKIKKELGQQAQKLKQAILEAISNYCINAVE
jgi:Mg2+ and Co2+ transporter CorA